MKTPIRFWVSSVFIAIFSVSPIAKAVNVVTMQCTIFDPIEKIYEVSSSTGVQLPVSATKGAPCAQAVADLLNTGYRLENSFAVQQLIDLTSCSASSLSVGACPGYAGPYYLFLK
jgi:hypothetical protein